LDAWEKKKPSTGNLTRDAKKEKRVHGRGGLGTGGRGGKGSTGLMYHEELLRGLLEELPRMERIIKRERRPRRKKRSFKEEGLGKREGTNEKKYKPRQSATTHRWEMKNTRNHLTGGRSDDQEVNQWNGGGETNEVGGMTTGARRIGENGAKRNEGLPHLWTCWC